METIKKAPRGDSQPNRAGINEFASFVNAAVDGSASAAAVLND